MTMYAFGARAEAIAYRLPGIETAVITDPEHLGTGYVAAANLRETGKPFYGMVLYEDVKSRIILAKAPDLIAQISDYDAKRGLLEQFCAGRLEMTDGHKSEDLWNEPDPGYHQALGEFAALCDALLVRSNAEFVRISSVIKRPRRFEPVVVEPALPAFSRVRPARPAVVVWAPTVPVESVAFFALALSEFLGEVTFVTAGGAGVAGFSGTFIAPDDAGEALGRTCCVLAADPDDPGAAVAFARMGLGVAAPISAGAHEFVRDVVTYDIGSLRSILTAVQIAIAQPASTRALPVPPAFPARPKLPPRVDMPKCSVIVPTYNRREDLARALTALSAQTYPNVEVLVVNDCGVDVADVVERFPIARLHTMAENGGVLKAIGAGLRQTDGEYVQLLADDDSLYPDHIEALIGALMRSGGTIAHGNTMIRYQDLVPGAEPVTTGYNAVIFNESTTPTDAMISTPVAGNSLLFRRDMFDAIGPWREDCILADQELQLRAANRFVFVYVDRMTAEWRARGTDNFSTNTDSSVEMRRIFEELHPVSGRPDLTQRRNIALEHVGRRVQGEFAFPPTLRVSSRAAVP